MERWAIKDSITAYLDDDRVRIVILGMIPAVVIVVLAFLGGVRSLVALCLIGISVFIILSVTFLLLPREKESPKPKIEFPKPSNTVYTFDTSKLRAHFKQKVADSSNMDWFNPAIDEDTLINVMVYLSSNGFVVDNSIKSLLTEKQDQELSSYLIEKGLAYHTDSIYEGGWALNAAGRSVVNRYLTYLLVHDSDAEDVDLDE